MADNRRDGDSSQTDTDVVDYAAATPTPSTAANQSRRTSTSSVATTTGNVTRESRDLQSQASMHASQTSQQSESTRRPRPRPLDYGSMNNTSGIRSPASQTPRRPGPARRLPSSNKPHRGAEFSVDDDVSEIDQDLELARQRTRENAQRDRAAALRRKDSTIRRRPTAAQAPTLPRLESEDTEDGVAQTTGNDAATVKAASIKAQEPSSEETLQGQEEVEEPMPESGDDDEEADDAADDGDVSDTESFTLRDRQDAINETHPFGIRIWKPALYKKSRSAVRNADGDIHSTPGAAVNRWLFLFNCLWTVLFGWWLSLVTGFGGVVCRALGVLGIDGCDEYGRVLLNLAHYLFYPFGKFIKLEHDETYEEEDQGEGRSIGEYERWQTGDLEEGRLFFGPTGINQSIIGRRREDLVDEPDETDSLLGRHNRNSADRAHSRAKKRLFGRGKWNVGRVIFFLSFYFLITPCLFFVSAICWFLVFTIPMGKVTLLLFYHLRRHPLAMSFHTDAHLGRATSSGSHSILMCTYRAVGLKYWKYTIDGTNIFLINLLGLVVFAIFDYFVLHKTLQIDSFLTSAGFNFVLALLSIIPLAYFIGQAVASISAQSSMGVGATINAFFSTIVEVFLYCIALDEGKAQLVEGSIIGSIFAGILFLPGLSMCFGALKRKTQRFNTRSASATNTMLLFAVIGAFGPTLFYQIYGSHELNCHACVKSHTDEIERDCRRCYFAQTPALETRFYAEAVKPFIWFCAVLLFFSYVIGLLFTLRTHAAVIWNNEPDEKKEVKTEQAVQHVENREARTGSVTAGTTSAFDPREAMTRHSTAATLGGENIRESQMYKRILNQSLKQAGMQKPKSSEETTPRTETQIPHLVPPKSSDGDAVNTNSVRIHGLSAEDNRVLVQQVAEIAATAAAVATRDATRAPRQASMMSSTRAGSVSRHHGSSHSKSKDFGPLPRTGSGEAGGLTGAETVTNDNATAVATGLHEAAPAAPGGHDAPNWSRTKSAIVLMTATVAYAIIAEILVDTVDAVLSNIDIDEKFLGITLFALVPNTTEFLNAISFAMNGNIALSMEIGNSYALQVMLLQIPALVLFSAIYGAYIDPSDVSDHTFSLIFPQWDMVTVILGVFLMGYVVGEGKSNYFKGSSLILTYLVFVVGFWFTGYNSLNTSGVDPMDTLALGTSERFLTVGRGLSGRAY
ncbi:hypothetical protein B0A48_18434 [Cryoendolithus antarcticus]|uniref:Uncharacterized protein n=1 Tax=Cryoendolithus antarcticus TaxID=1507870 RepID=A0A1V8S8Q0_9PEZI|nr:hypothetical protein B0A48_18434 [Cryoendolithus antarcticus]